VKSAEEPVECLDNILVDRLNRLETSSKDWKKRIEQKDTTNFTVAGKMQNKSLPPLSPVLMSITQRSSLEKSSTSNCIALLIFIDFNRLCSLRYYKK
jgi:supervillin